MHLCTPSVRYSVPHEQSLQKGENALCRLGDFFSAGKREGKVIQDKSEIIRHFPKKSHICSAQTNLYHKRLQLYCRDSDTARTRSRLTTPNWGSSQPHTGRTALQEGPVAHKSGNWFQIQGPELAFFSLGRQNIVVFVCTEIRCRSVLELGVWRYRAMTPLCRTRRPNGNTRAMFYTPFPKLWPNPRLPKSQKKPSVWLIFRFFLSKCSLWINSSPPCLPLGGF